MGWGFKEEEQQVHWPCIENRGNEHLQLSPGEKTSCGESL